MGAVTLLVRARDFASIESVALRKQSRGGFVQDFATFPGNHRKQLARTRVIDPNTRHRNRARGVLHHLENVSIESGAHRKPIAIRVGYADKFLDL